ncbi:MAG: hypothetical protein WBE37_33130 [Bryobacteraceae bacterium]
MTHFAVESALGFRRGFFGLIAEGWEIADTTGKQARGPLPSEAREVEFIVGTLDGERASGAIWTAEDFNHNLANHLANCGELRRLTDEEQARVRLRCAELFAQWHAVAPGELLELRHPF